MNKAWVHRDIAIKYRRSLAVSRRTVRRHTRVARRLAKGEGVSFNLFCGATTFCVGVALAGYSSFLFLVSEPLQLTHENNQLINLPVRFAPSAESFSERLTKKQKREMATKVHFIATKMIPYRVSLTEGHRIARVIVEESYKTGFDPILIAAIVFAESAFSKHAISSVGALGLMQLMPDTARYVTEMNALHWQGIEALYSPEYNIKLGTRYLRYLMHMYNGDVLNSLRAYNWGPGNMDRFLKRGGRLPAETRGYVKKINHYYETWSQDFSMDRVKYEFGALYHAIY